MVEYATYIIFSHMLRRDNSQTESAVHSHPFIVVCHWIFSQSVSDFIFNYLSLNRMSLNSFLIVSYILFHVSESSFFKVLWYEGVSALISQNPHRGHQTVLPLAVPVFSLEAALSHRFLRGFPIRNALYAQTHQEPLWILATREEPSGTVADGVRKSHLRRARLRKSRTHMHTPIRAYFTHCLVDPKMSTTVYALLTLQLLNYNHFKNALQQLL